MNDEFVLKGNTAILKCIVPSFVADFVHVVAWIMDNQTISAQDNSNLPSGISLLLDILLSKEHTLLFLSLILKCHLK